MATSEKPKYAVAVESFKLLVEETKGEVNLKELLKTMDNSYKTYEEDVDELLDTTIHIGFPSGSAVDNVVIEGLDRVELLNLITLGYQLLEQAIYKETDNE